ncbi:PAS domain S-box-containing protein [Lewinella aquimaris]|uniref:histidine kinase n=1 Tax=Neolewinella aquimaris TaxID=1835722 RepID=A0A840E410_9BACT|nr:response regulator [Neolewinella aquimaris]MBB4079921.1 PAS domain S-box-containing protein [Neolewinella aquimaris]
MTEKNPLSSLHVSQQIDERAGQLFESAPCGYLFTSTTGRFLRVNQTFCEWLGYTSAELVGSCSLIDLVSRGSRIFFETHFFPVLNLQGTVEEINLTLQRKDGSRFPVLISATQHHDPEGRFLFNSLIILNFAVRKQYESELLEAKKRAESSDRAKSYFLSTISHEVLTPLNAIIGMSDLLETTNLTPHQSRLQSILSKSAVHLLQLFKNVLVVSKAGLGQLKVASNPFDLRELTHSVVNSFRFDSRNHGLELHVEIDNRLPETLVGDATLISQLLTNLVGNAVKFTDGGSVRTQLSVRELTPQEVVIEFSIADTGIGIPAEKLKKLFVPFSQASKDIHSRYGGSGLGLAICSSILEQLDSQMEVETEVGVGSRFSFELTLPRGETPPQPSPPPHKLPRINRGRVLLVEDNDTNAYLVSRYFRQWNVAFDIATDGKDAIEQVQEKEYDLILMDLRMPVMNGYDAAAHIRQLKAPRGSIPIIAFSASSSLTMSSRMREAQIDDFLLKPFAPGKLHAILLEYLPALLPKPEDMSRTRFSQLRQTFDEDPEELAAFAVILERELLTAATELDAAIAATNARTVGDLKHKLKTSMQLLGAGELMKRLGYITEDLKNQEPVEPQRQRQVVADLRELAHQLKNEKW